MRNYAFTSQNQDDHLEYNRGDADYLGKLYIGKLYLDKLLKRIPANQCVI